MKAMHKGKDDEVALPVSSSTPPEFLPEAVQCYEGVLEALQHSGIDFAIAGAFALHKHTGIWRTTKDLDLVMEARFVPAALRGLQEMGFNTYIKDPVWLAKAMRGDYFVDIITGLSNSALIVDGEWMDRAVPDVVFGVPCRVLAAEEIIASKIFISRRERFDGADIAHLIRARGAGLNWERIQHLLRGHSELLLWSLIFFSYIYPSRVNLVPRHVWTDLLRRFEDHIHNPESDVPFRGMLIDPNMFAIDVAEWGEHDLQREYCERRAFLLGSVQFQNRSPQ